VGQLKKGASFPHVSACELRVELNGHVTVLDGAVEVFKFNIDLSSVGVDSSVGRFKFNTSGVVN